MSRVIRIISVGKTHDPLLVDAITEYEKRCTNTLRISWQLIAPAKEASIEKTVATEGNHIIKNLKEAEYVILLDEKGSMLTSEHFSDLVFDSLSKNNAVTIIIGGAYGVSSEVKHRADTVMAFGRMVLPHQLMRLVLCEQLYRAVSIHNGNKYHHS